MILSDNARGAVYMSVAMAVFTFNDTCMKLVTQTVPTFEAALLRGIVTLAALLVLAPWLGGLKLRFDRQAAGILALRCLGEVGATVTFLIALRHMPLANISAIMQSLPLAVTLGAAVFLAEPVGWRRGAAIAVGFLGVLLIVRPGTDGFNVWSMAALASVAAVVLRDLSTRRLPSGVPSVSVTFYSALSVTLLSAVLAPIEGFQPVGGFEAALIVAAAGFVIAGYMFVVMVMRVGEIGFIAPFRYTALIWAIFLGWLVFGQLPGGATLAGAAVVIATGVFTLWRERRRIRRGPAPLRIR